MTDSSSSLGSSLVMMQSAALRWRYLTDTQSSSHGIAEQNEQTLQVMLSLEDHHGEFHEVSPALVNELARIDRKLNILLDLVNQLVSAHLDLPRPTTVWLESGALCWIETGTCPREGEKILIELYLEPRYPRPLYLLATVTASTTDGADKKVHACLMDLVPGIADWIDKLIFRHHRRQVALARRGSD